VKARVFFSNRPLPATFFARSRALGTDRCRLVCCGAQVPRTSRDSIARNDERIADWTIAERRSRIAGADVVHARKRFVGDAPRVARAHLDDCTVEDCATKSSGRTREDSVTDTNHGSDCNTCAGKGLRMLGAWRCDAGCSRPMTLLRIATPDAGACTKLFSNDVCARRTTSHAPRDDLSTFVVTTIASSERNTSRWAAWRVRFHAIGPWWKMQVYVAIRCRNAANRRWRSGWGGGEKYFLLGEEFWQKSAPKHRYGDRLATQRHPRRISSAAPGISIERTSCPNGV
jgi:hypothetical protein